MNSSQAHAIQEQCKRELKYFQVYDSFKPNYGRLPVTRKFYSRHELTNFSKADPKILKDVRMFLDYGPKMKRDYPETTNQVYGWITEPLVPQMRDDNRFFRPTTTADFIKHEFKILADVMMKRPVFGGKPFFLQ